MARPAARVLVTRPAREAAPWVQALQARGLAAEALPLIAIGPCTDPAARAAVDAARQGWPQYRALMFVSGNAVAEFFGSNPALVLESQARAAIKTRAWAPGPGTAAALRQAGVAAACIDSPAADAAQFDSEALWVVVAPQVQSGDRVLIVRGRSPGGDALQGTGREWLAAQVAARGGAVETLAVYERGPAPLDAAALARAQAATHDGSWWLLSSSEALGYLAAALPGTDWRAARAVATHPRIAASAQRLGFGCVRESRPALDDVVASIESAA